MTIELRIDGTPVPEPTASMLSQPAVLRARAAIRRAIAAQDIAWGDTWAFHRNTSVAQELEARAEEAEHAKGHR